MNHKKRVLIVGAGLAGLCCARELQKNDVSTLILEADDRVGGRLRTDLQSGYLLDHGFQVLLTSYPEARKTLNLDHLRLGQFEPGALIRFNGRFHRFVDPWRRPLSVFSTLFSPLATFSDKIRIAKLRQTVLKLDEAEIRNRPQSSTSDYLRNCGFSSKIIDRFFRPFFGGVFLESDLSTSSAKFEYLFKMFSTGQAALPEKGMQSIAEQLAEGLAPESIELGARVERLTENGLILTDGREFSGSQVVLATPAHVSARLLGADQEPDFQRVACIYFSADHSPLKTPSLVLNGEGSGPVNTVCVPSDIKPTYAPDGNSLVSVSVLDPHLETDTDNLVAKTRVQLREWFGGQVDQWQHLKTYVITHALPQQTPAQLQSLNKPSRQTNGILVCGDHMGIASIQGAMQSGRETAEAILKKAVQ